MWRDFSKFTGMGHHEVFDKAEVPIMLVWLLDYASQTQNFKGIQVSSLSWFH